MPLQARQIRIFVSVTGNDDNEGTKEAPLATLKAAIGKLEGIYEDVDVIITLGKGTFQITKPILITPSLWTGKIKKLSIYGAGMGKTIISGGVELPSFSQKEDSKIWSVSLGQEYGDISKIEQLYVNGHRAIMARTPNTDRYIVPIKAQETIIEGQKDMYEQEVFLNEDDYISISNSLKIPSNVRISIFHYWDMSRRVVKSFHKERNIVHIKGSSVKRWNYFTQKNTTQLYFENDKSFLDTPGEYYYDPEEKILYYYPYEDESLEESVAIMPFSEGILRIIGTSDSDIHNIHIKNLTLSYSDYKMPVGGEEPEQAVMSKNATVVLDYVTDVNFTNVEICHTGLNAIWFRSACKSSKMENCYLHDLGAGGVKIGVTYKIETEAPTLTKEISIKNCIIREGGRVLPPAVGIAILKASDCLITHNEISDFYYSGISAGWTWGFDSSPTKRNTISYNHIHHLGWGGLSDLGGIYTLGKSEGTVITNNVIHDVYAFGADGNGIYLDEGTSNIIVSNNVVYNCKSAGFAQHYGKANKVVNNIFANNLKAQLVVGTAEQEKQSLSFINNVVYTSKGHVFSNDLWANYTNIKSDSNIYWVEGDEKALLNNNLNDWYKKTGKDKHSLNVNPGVNFDTSGIIRLTNKKVIKRISFTPINCKEAGVYGSKEWIRLAEMNVERLSLYKRLIEKYEGM